MKLSVFLSFVLVANMGFAGESGRHSQKNEEVKKDYFFTFEQFKDLNYAQQMVYLNFLTSYQAVLELSANDNKFVEEKWLSVSNEEPDSMRLQWLNKFFENFVEKAEAWLPYTIGKAVVTKGGSKIWSWGKSLFGRGASTAADDAAVAGSKAEDVIAAGQKMDDAVLAAEKRAADKASDLRDYEARWGKPGRSDSTEFTLKEGAATDNLAKEAIPKNRSLVPYKQPGELVPYKAPVPTKPGLVEKAGNLLKHPTTKAVGIGVASGAVGEYAVDKLMGENGTVVSEVNRETDEPGKPGTKGGANGTEGKQSEYDGKQGPNGNDKPISPEAAKATAEYKKQPGKLCIFGNVASHYQAASDGKLYCVAPKNHISTKNCKGVKMPNWECPSVGLSKASTAKILNKSFCVPLFAEGKMEGLTVRCNEAMKKVVTSKERPAGIDEKDYTDFVKSLKRQTDEMMGSKLAGSTLKDYCADGNKINGGKQEKECASINDLIAVLGEQKIEAQPVKIAAVEQTPVSNIPAPASEQDLGKGQPVYDDLPPVPENPK